MQSEFERYRVFLCEYLHVNEIPHGKRTLWDHLVGTSDLLAKWGNSSPIVVAGLFHSIYGTQFFKTTAFPVQGRWIIKRLIGEEAESIVHVFCTSDRKDFLIHGGYRAINEIEMANLLEQSSYGFECTNAISDLVHRGDLTVGAKAAGVAYLSGLGGGEKIC